ncbi:MAG: prepilin-type N-terminal cleavage/methylation domain-containing protein [Candidatus Paceibacterota bacterium]
MHSPHTNTTHTGGFTLIEVMVAMFLLALVVAAGATAASSGLRATFAASDRVTAFYMAQEAVEVVKNIRDTNAKKGSSWHWLNGIDPCIGTTCEADGIAGTLSTCSNCTVLRDGANGFFGDTGDGTRFTRVVEIEEIGSEDREIRVDVTMTWDDNKLIISEHVFNWRI